MKNITIETVPTLKPGQEFKNYAELCNALHITPKGGKAKTLQMQEIERYVNLEKKGHKLIVKEIYQSPIPKEYSKGIYTENIRIGIMATLNKYGKSKGDDEENNFCSCSLTKRDWMMQVGMFNAVYYNMNDKIPCKAECKDVESLCQRIFSDEVDHKSYDVFNSAIKTLENRGIIAQHEDVYVIYGYRHQNVNIPEAYYVQDAIISTDKSASEYVEKCMDNYEGDFPKYANISPDVHEANNFEKYIIAHIDYILCRKYNIKNIYSAHFLPIGTRNKFDKERREYYESLGWHFAHKYLTIRFNKEDLKREINDELARTQLNQSLVDFYINKFNTQYAPKPHFGKEPDEKIILKPDVEVLNNMVRKYIAL